MPTRNVLLTDRQEELIAQLLRGGRYQNASEVIREGLRLVEEREAGIVGLVWLEHLGGRIDRIEQGEEPTVSLDEAERRVGAMFDQTSDA